MPTDNPFLLGDCVYTPGYNYTLNASSSDYPWVSGPGRIVTDHVALSQRYAKIAFNDSWCFLKGLAEYAPSLKDLSYNVNFDEVTLPTPVFAKPDEPPTPVLRPLIPNFPPSFVVGDIHEFDENAIGTLPSFTTPAPNINLPPTPAPLEAVAPTDEPDIKTEFDFPTPVPYTLPSVPTFEELNLPAPLSISLPDFELDIPVLPATLVPPGIIFNFKEQAYSSTLLTALSTELLNRIQNGGTGLSPEIEQAIWDRARNREDQNAIRSENQLSIEQASRGLSRPSGSYLAALDQLAQETQNKNADLSREIAIKQADLEQKNMEFALQTSLALEQTLIQYHNQVQQRSFEVGKFVQETAINIYEAQIKQFGLQVEIYKTYSQAFESRVRAELAKVEVYKTELEGQKLISEINEQQVRLYTAQLAGIKTAVDIYIAEVGAVESQIRAEALKLENFKSLVEVFATQVAAKKSEYDMYSSAVQGEMSKINIFDSQVKAFVSRVDAYAKQVDTESTRIDADIKTEGLRLQSYLAKLDSEVKRIGAEADIAKSSVDLFQSQAAMYQAEVGAEAARLDAEGKVYDLTLQKARYAAEVELKNAEINLENAKNSVTLILEAMKSGAQVGSGLAQAALSSLNIGADISGGYRHNHNYNYDRE